ncbi:activity-regulated cytoskeleton associated protein 1-like [Photinus pyralis]|uniref:activity-regulated cytoskeleton associated protein 1-like n=1 Tax=Photinus pyralis TaxID=7054 RepID=UPI00126702ED|nr:activity-regulated cytoskeleton associated protein 1-like [Photinus pyralis]
MTADMLKELIQSLSTPRPPSTGGSFAKCTARFDGKGDAQAFVDNITTYKDCTAISEENALTGMSMLLDKDAATWWQGTFGPQKPPHKLLRELFETEQGPSDPTMLFISKKRAILSRIEDEISEAVQLHMVYGLLTTPTDPEKDHPHVFRHLRGPPSRASKDRR